jgi:hypothetical protein
LRQTAIDLQSMTPLGRIVRPKLAAAAGFLASDASSIIIGIAMGSDMLQTVTPATFRRSFAACPRLHGPCFLRPPP